MNIYLTDITIDLNLGSFITFGLGVFFGILIFTLVYFITSVSVLNKKNESAVEELNTITEKDINLLIDKYIEAFEDEMNSRPVEPTPEERQAQALEAIAEGATSETTAAMEALLNGEG